MNINLEAGIKKVSKKYGPDLTQDALLAMVRRNKVFHSQNIFEMWLSRTAKTYAIRLTKRRQYFRDVVSPEYAMLLDEAFSLNEKKEVRTIGNLKAIAHAPEWVKVLLVSGRGSKNNLQWEKFNKWLEENLE